MKTVTVRIGARGRPGAAGASSWTDITGKPSTFPPSSHTHAIADTTGLQAALDAKAASSHTHAQSDVTGLEAALAGKAASSHTHAQSDVTGLEAALAGKAASSHTHALSAITQSGATNNQVPAWNGSAWVPTTPTSGSAITTPKVLHVTTAGNDTTGDGSLGAPYLTGTKAFTVALALTGQNVCIQFGVGEFSCLISDVWPDRISVRGMGANVSKLNLSTDDHVVLWSDRSIDVVVVASSSVEAVPGPNITLRNVHSTGVYTQGGNGASGEDGTPGDEMNPGGDGGAGGDGGTGGGIALIDCWCDSVESAGGSGGNGGNGGADNGGGSGNNGGSGNAGPRGSVLMLRSHVGALYCGAYDMGCSNLVTVNEGSSGSNYGGNSAMPVPSL